MDEIFFPSLFLILSVLFCFYSIVERKRAERKFRHYEIIEKDIYKMFKLIRNRLNKIERHL